MLFWLWDFNGGLPAVDFGECACDQRPEGMDSKMLEFAVNSKEERGYI